MTLSSDHQAASRSNYKGARARSQYSRSNTNENLSVSPMDDVRGLTICLQVSFLCPYLRSERVCGTCSVKFLTHMQDYCVKCRKAYNQGKSSQASKPYGEAAEPPPFNGEAARTSEGLRPASEARSPAGTGGERLDDTKPRHDTHATLSSALSDNSSAEDEPQTYPSAVKARQGDSEEVRPVATALQQRSGDLGPKLEHEHTHTGGGARQNEKVIVSPHTTEDTAPPGTRTGTLLAREGVKCNPTKGRDSKEERHISEAERSRREEQSATDRASSAEAKKEEEKCKSALETVREARRRDQSERAKLARQEAMAAASAAVKAKEAMEAGELSAIRKAIGAAAEERAGKQIADGLLPACPWSPVKRRGVAWRERGGSRDARAGTREVNHVKVGAAEMANERVREMNALKKLRIDSRLSKELSRGTRIHA